jgi:hypothetical protein
MIARELGNFTVQEGRRPAIKHIKMATTSDIGFSNEFLDGSVRFTGTEPSTSSE